MPSITSWDFSASIGSTAVAAVKGVLVNAVGDVKEIAAMALPKGRSDK